MLKYFYLTLFFTTFFVVANANVVDPKKDVDPEKEQKKNKSEQVSKENIKDQHTIGKEQPLIGKDQIVKFQEGQKSQSGEKPAAKNEEHKVGEDVQSFNLIYYIIHQFKFSDFVTE